MYPLIHFNPLLFELPRERAFIAGKIRAITAEVNALFLKARSNFTGRQTSGAPLPASYAIRVGQQIQYRFKLRISPEGRGMLGHARRHVTKPLQAMLQDFRRLGQGAVLEPDASAAIEAAGGELG